MSKRLTRQQYWEIIIVVVLLLVVTYRVALVYDYIPEEYQPSVVLGEAYVEFKKGLQMDVNEQGMFSDGAKWTLDRLDALEKYFYNQKLRYARAKMISERCQENMIFRFFMYLGDEENPNCTKSNLVLENAVKDIDKDKRRADPNAVPGIAPRVTDQPQPQQPPSN